MRLLNMARSVALLFMCSAAVLHCVTHEAIRPLQLVFSAAVTGAAAGCYAARDEMKTAGVIAASAAAVLTVAVGKQYISKEVGLLSCVLGTTSGVVAYKVYKRSKSRRKKDNAGSSDKRGGMLQQEASELLTSNVLSHVTVQNTVSSQPQSATSNNVSTMGNNSDSGNAQSNTMQEFESKTNDNILAGTGYNFMLDLHIDGGARKEFEEAAIFFSDNVHVKGIGIHVDSQSIRWADKVSVDQKKQAKNLLDGWSYRCQDRFYKGQIKDAFDFGDIYCDMWKYFEGDAQQSWRFIKELKGIWRFSIGNYDIKGNAQEPDIRKLLNYDQKQSEKQQCSQFIACFLNESYSEFHKACRETLQEQFKDHKSYAVLNEACQSCDNFKGAYEQQIFSSKDMIELVCLLIMEMSVRYNTQAYQDIKSITIRLGGGN